MREAHSKQLIQRFNGQIDGDNKIVEPTPNGSSSKSQKSDAKTIMGKIC